MKDRSSRERVSGEQLRAACEAFREERGHYPSVPQLSAYSGVSKVTLYKRAGEMEGVLNYRPRPDHGVSLFRDDILAYVREKFDGIGLSLTEIAEELDCSLPTVAYHIYRMAQEGLVDYEPHKHRSIRPVYEED